MQNTDTESYNEIIEYLSHQTSWIEAELGEDLAAVLKEELDDDK